MALPEDPEAIRSQKRALRARLLAERAALTPAEVVAASAAVAFLL